MVQIVLVSNRLPVSIKKTNGKLEVYPSSGGLATGMSSFTKRKGTVWIGWPGLVNEELTPADRKNIVIELAKHNCKPVFLTRKQLDDFYNGYSNSVLWPHLHNMALPEKQSKKYWDSYIEVNKLFAKAVGQTANNKSTIWVHDYQLLLLPQMLRDRNKNSSIGFFMHIPFPDSNHFNEVKEAKPLIKGILGADLIGFHTSAYANHFLDACDNLGLGVVSPNRVIINNRSIHVGEFPMGIDYDKFTSATASKGVEIYLNKFTKQYSKFKTILTVDRLDPTKAFPERLKAFKTLLKDNPELHGKVKLVMIAVPSRTDIPVYKKLKARVDKLVSEINKTYGSKSWQPIDYRFTSVPFDELSALYQIADIAFVAPIRDGMNLVAKEYIASKNNGRGVLILSQTAGAAEELADALIVNPKESKSLVSALNKALNMSPSELQNRLTQLQQKVANNSVHNWANNFMTGLQLSANKRGLLTQPLTKFFVAKLQNDFKNTEQRLLLLDYDGVLSPYKPLPDQARPPENLLKILDKLARMPGIKVAIISGRNRQNLDEWLGKLPVDLIAEHGAEYKINGGWRQVAKNANWKDKITPVLVKYADITPGAFVEEKNYSMVWHFRLASPYYSQKHIIQMSHELKPLLERHKLQQYRGKKIIEIKSPKLNKGDAIKHLLKASYGFIMAIGDDYTDEHMFAELPDNAYTIKVGWGLTVAHYRLGHSDDVIKLLTDLAR